MKVWYAIAKRETLRIDAGSAAKGKIQQRRTFQKLAMIETYDTGRHRSGNKSSCEP